jgi:hypothetical protein
MTTKPDPDKDRRADRAPEDDREEPGAEGGSDSSAAHKLPGTPSPDDESALGDTDQHSSG